MKVFPRRQSFSAFLKPWLWLLLAVLCAGLPAEVPSEKSLGRAVDSLSAPVPASYLIAAPLKSKPAKLPVPLHTLLALPYVAFAVTPYDSTTLQKPDSPLLPLFATCPEPYPPRPPPTV